jgi:hypothetical protein
MISNIVSSLQEMPDLKVSTEYSGLALRKNAQCLVSKFELLLAKQVNIRSQIDQAPFDADQRQTPNTAIWIAVS